MGDWAYQILGGVGSEAMGAMAGTGEKANEHISD